MKKTFVISALLLGLASGPVLTQTALAETAPEVIQTTPSWSDQLKTKIDLAAAKVAALRAQVALEIEKSPERAQQALDDAEARLAAARTRLENAKDSASEAASNRIQALREDVKSAKDAVISAPEKARAKVGDLVDKTEDRIQDYKEIALDTDEAKLLKKRYAELQGQASLLKAQLAEKVDATGEKARSYLDRAKAFYADAKANTAKKWHATIDATTTKIDAAKQAIKHKRDQAGAAIKSLTKRAADMVRGEKAAPAQ